MLEQSLCMIGSPLVCHTPSTAPVPSPCPFLQALHIRNSLDQLTQASESSPQQQRTNSRTNRPIQHTPHLQNDLEVTHVRSFPKDRAIEGPYHPSVYSISGVGRSIRSADPNIWELLTAKQKLMKRLSQEVTLGRGPPHALRSVHACPSFTGGLWQPCEISVEMKFHEISTP